MAVPTIDLTQPIQGPTPNLAAPNLGQSSSSYSLPTLPNGQPDLSAPNPDYVNQQVAQAEAEAQGPRYSGLKGVFLNKDSAFNLQNLGGTAAMLGTDAIGALLAPETGGLSLAGAAALSSALGAAGSVAGKAAQNKLTGKSLGFNLPGAAVSGAIGGGLGTIGGKVVGGLLQKAASPVAELLTSKGEGLALSSLGIGNGAAKTWGAANKEALSDYLVRTGQIGSTPDDIATTADQWGNAYNEIARNSGVKIPISDIKSAIDQSIGSVGDMKSSAGNRFISNLQAERDFALNNLKPDAQGNVDIGQLADLKSEYQRQAYGNRATNPTGVNDVEQTMADSLMGKLNDVADANGLKTPDGRSLSQVGQDLQKQSRLNSLIQKNAYASPDASRPINTGKIIRALGGAGVGAMAGGPAGGLAGMVAEPVIEAALNNPAAIKAISNASQKAAPMVGSALGRVGQAIGSVGGRAAIGEGVQGLISSSQPSGPILGEATGAQPALAAPASLASNNFFQSSPSLSGPSLSGDMADQAVQAMQQGIPLTQSQYQALLQKDLVTTGGRFADKITAAYQAGNPTAVQGLNTASQSVGTLQNLYEQAGGAKGRISGDIASAIGSLGLDTESSVNAYNKQKNLLGQEIISQIYGSSGTAEDRDQVLAAIPDISDPPVVAQSKLNTLRTLIRQRVNSLTSSTPQIASQNAGGPSLTL